MDFLGATQIMEINFDKIISHKSLSVVGSCFAKLAAVWGDTFCPYYEI